jgi:hypothetical protein
MGYYTKYTLFIEENTSKEESEAIDTVLGEYSELLYHHDTELKWYEHEQFLVEVSVLFPHLTFILTCIGEVGDMWKKRFVNGHVDRVKAEIRWPEFPNK